MRVSTRLEYAGDFKEPVDELVEYEQAGLDATWVPEAYGFDSVSLMGYIAAKTETVKIGSGILPIYSRTPALIAMTAAGLDTLSEERFILGMGVSGPQVIEGFHGVPFDRPITRTRELIEICRKVWKREPLDYDGDCYQLPLPEDEGKGMGKPLKMITEPSREDIPIVVASLGEQNVRMTAQIADGWMPTFYWPEKASDVWGDALQDGKAERDPELDDLEIVAGGRVAIGEDVEEYREFARPQVALYVGGMGSREENFYNDLFKRYGFEEAAEEIQDLYLDGQKDEAASRVPEEFLEATSLIGPESYVKERISAFKESGVTILDIVPVGDTVQERAETIGKVKDLIQTA